MAAAAAGMDADIDIDDAEMDLVGDEESKYYIYVYE